MKPLSQMTRQEVFDKIKTHLLTQNQRCSDSGRCLYRCGALMCAAGCVITNYDSSFEHKTFRQLVEQRLVQAGPHTDMISDLQKIHDHHWPESWRYMLAQYAHFNGLDGGP